MRLPSDCDGDDDFVCVCVCYVEYMCFFLFILSRVGLCVCLLLLILLFGECGLRAHSFYLFPHEIVTLFFFGLLFHTQFRSFSFPFSCFVFAKYVNCQEIFLLSMLAHSLSDSLDDRIYFIHILMCISTRTASLLRLIMLFRVCFFFLFVWLTCRQCVIINGFFGREPRTKMKW